MGNGKINPSTSSGLTLSKAERVKISIVGGSGYAGGELLRLLFNHPKVEILQATSQEFIGWPISSVHPNLRGKTELLFSDIKKLRNCDLLFLAMPNGISMGSIEEFRKLSPRIIDLAADFRLNSAEEWQLWYKTCHQKPELMADFIYGLPELHREEIKKANLVAGPGCEAIVSILCLWPLIKYGVIGKEKIVIDAKMASSEAGSKPTFASHHPERAGVVRSYQPTGHRHTAEIEQELTINCEKPKVLISATAIEMVRGILVTIQTFLKQDLPEKEIWKIYRQEYEKEPFIRIVKEFQGLYRYPEPKILQGTNFCEIGFEKDTWNNRLVVIGAIDNLVKGTAGNAVQCLNLMMGYPETLGLEFPGLHPI